MDYQLFTFLLGMKSDHSPLCSFGSNPLFDINALEVIQSFKGPLIRTGFFDILDFFSNFYSHHIYPFHRFHTTFNIHPITGLIWISFAHLGISVNSDFGSCATDFIGYKIIILSLDSKLIVKQIDHCAIISLCAIDDGGMFALDAPGHDERPYAVRRFDAKGQLSNRIALPRNDLTQMDILPKAKQFVLFKPHELLFIFSFDGDFLFQMDLTCLDVRTTLNVFTNPMTDMIFIANNKYLKQFRAQNPTSRQLIDYDSKILFICKSDILACCSVYQSTDLLVLTSKHLQLLTLDFEDRYRVEKQIPNPINHSHSRIDIQTYYMTAHPFVRGACFIANGVHLYILHCA